MDLISVDLAFVTRLDVVVAVNLHGHPTVVCPQDFLHRRVSTSMRPKGTFMYLHYNLVFLLLVHTPK